MIEAAECRRDHVGEHVPGMIGRMVDRFIEKNTQIRPVASEGEFEQTVDFPVVSHVVTPQMR